MSEPRTEAGKALLRAFDGREIWGPEEAEAAILAIEEQAASLPATRCRECGVIDPLTNYGHRRTCSVWTTQVEADRVRFERPG